MFEKQKFLNIHPFVYYYFNTTGYIFINTLDKACVFGFNSQILEWLTKNFKVKNIGTINIPENIKSNNCIINFLDSLVINNMADICQYKGANPALISRNLDIRLERMLEYSDSLRRDNVLEFLFYIDEKSNEKEMNYSYEYTKQISFPINSTITASVLAPKDILVLANKFKLESKKCEFIFADLSKLLSYKKTFELFRKINITSTIIEVTENLSILTLLKEAGIEFNLNIFVNVKKIEKSYLQTLVEKCLTYKIKNEYRFIFIIEGENDFERVQNEIINFYPKINNEFRPFYNGENYLFFEENVFFGHDDIVNDNMSISKILSKSKINLNDFGRLIILPNGDVYTNLYNNPIGNIYNDVLDEIIYSAHFDNSSSWFFTRQKVSTCKKCLYHEICPSIGNYELALNKYNLCDI